MRQELRLCLSTPDQHKGVSQRARPSLPRETSNAPDKRNDHHPPTHRRVAMHNMRHFKVQGGSRLYPRHAQIAQLQRLRLSTRHSRGCSSPQSQRCKSPTLQSSHTHSYARICAPSKKWKQKSTLPNPQNSKNSSVAALLAIFKKQTNS